MNNFSTMECYQSVHKWGETVITNICTGTSSHVPWGTLDYITTTCLTVLGVSFSLMLLAMAFATSKAAWTMKS